MINGPVVQLRASERANYPFGAILSNQNGRAMHGARKPARACQQSTRVKFQCGRAPNRSFTTRDTIELPTFQSETKFVPNIYCLMISGFVRASQTLARGVLMVVVAFATSPLPILLFFLFLFGVLLARLPVTPPC